MHQARYNQLAGWADERLAAVGRNWTDPCHQIDQKRNENDPGFLEVMAQQKMDQGKYEEAQTHVDEAIKRKPDNIELLLLRATIHYALASIANQKFTSAKENSKEAQMFEANLDPVLQGFARGL